MQGHTHDNGDTDNYCIMQWQCTPNPGNVSLPPQTLQLIANQETNPALFHYRFKKISPEHFPAIILHDAAGLLHVSDLDEANYSPMMQTLAIGLNLYMVSGNCDVTKSKNLLLKEKQLSIASFSETSTSTGLQTFNGVIFANGTTLDKAPIDFCRTCTYNDTSSIDHSPSNNASQKRSKERTRRVNVTSSI